VSEAIYAVVLAMAVITTIAAPPLIKFAFAGEQALGKAPELDDELQQRIG